jgi:hypothetical protein
MKAAALAPVVGLLLAALALLLAPGIASADFSVDPTPNGLTITTYTGALEEFADDGDDLNLVSAFATVEGAFVGFVFGAPDFVNEAFIDEFAGGLNNQGLIVRAGDAPAMTPTATATATATAEPTETAEPTATGTELPI